MSSRVRHLVKVALCFVGLLSISSAAPLLDECDFQGQDVITRDVCIIGGGATGTYASVRLSQDLGKSVIVVEKDDRLGGHTQTYIDPVTHFSVDYGVIAYHNLSVVTDFFGRFNVSLTIIPQTSPFTSDYVDLSTGKVVQGYTGPNISELTAALEVYTTQLQKYPYLPGGYALPDPVPEDLLLPFSEFVTKYGIQAALPLIITFADGVGDLLNATTLYVFSEFGLAQITSLFTNSFLTTANHDNSELYLKASALLGSNVLYNSTLVNANRTDNGTQYITVQTPTGVQCIKAKKLLVTMPPVLDNLAPFSLDHQECSIFEQWQYTTYYAGVIRSGIPDNTSVVNVAPNTSFNVPSPPYVRSYDFTGIPGLHNFNYISLEQQTAAQVEEQVMSEIWAMWNAGTFPASNFTMEVLSNHAPTKMRVSVDSIKNGFYNDLYSLQGLHGTFWTGAAWGPDNSALLWAFTEGLFPMIVAALG